MPTHYKITLSLGALGVEANPAKTAANVNDVVTFLSGGGDQMIIRFFKNQSPFRTGKGGVIKTVQASQPHTCMIEGDYSFFCEIRDESGDIVAYDINNGGDLKVGP